MAPLPTSAHDAATSQPAEAMCRSSMPDMSVRGEWRLERKSHYLSLLPSPSGGASGGAGDGNTASLLFPIHGDGGRASGGADVWERRDSSSRSPAAVVDRPVAHVMGNDGRRTGAQRPEAQMAD
jgi:hypothetical protein